LLTYFLLRAARRSSKESEVKQQKTKNKRNKIYPPYLVLVEVVEGLLDPLLFILLSRSRLASLAHSLSFQLTFALGHEPFLILELVTDAVKVLAHVLAARGTLL
jgi:hypothetical protein